MSKKTKHIAGLLFVIVIIIITKPSLANRTEATTPDSIFIKGGSYIVIDNKLMYFKTDTIIINSDTITINKNTKNAKKSADFYNKLEEKSIKKKFVGKFYSLIFVSA
ncbi:MAG: hypothetical protein KAG95_07100, partial [Bacteroidales bacterium]|nr:hypothetical protein [Bacteroidales bacterium]